MRQRYRRVAPDAKLPVPTIGTVGSGGGASPAIQVDGTLAVCTDVGSYVAQGVSRVNAVYIRCETSGTAGTTIVDIHLNGVTIFTAQGNRPMLVWNDPDGVAKSGAPDITALVENDVLTVEIDQVATGAEDLVVVIDIDLVIGLVGPMGLPGAQGLGGAGLKAIFWHVDGPLVTGTEVGEARLLPQDIDFTKAYIYCKATGTAGNTIVDIHKNGVTIYTIQGNRPTLAWNDPDKKAVTVAPDVTAGLEGDIMTIDIDQAATGAEDLVIVLLFAGVIGSLPFGSCYGNHIAWVQAAAVQNNWYNISDANIADGQLYNVTHDGSGELTVTEPGRYLVTYSLCYLDNQANDHLEVGIEVSDSGAAELAGRTHSENKFANEEEHLGGCAILDLADNATLELAIRTIDAGNPTITVDGMNLAAVMIRGG